MSEYKNVIETKDKTISVHETRITTRDKEPQSLRQHNERYCKLHAGLNQFKTERTKVKEEFTGVEENNDYLTKANLLLAHTNEN
jgi:hypothetical protein